MTNEPHILPGCSVLPPLDERRLYASQSEADADKGKRHRSRTRGRFEVLNAFVDAGMVGLGRAGIATWLTLYRDTRNGTARTSAGDIARRAGLSRKAVSVALGKLRRRGQLTVVYRGGLNRGPSVYRVHPVPQ